MSLHQVVDETRGRVDMIRIQFSDGNDVLGLGDDEIAQLLADEITI